MAKPKHKTRDAWLLAGVDALRSLFTDHDYTVPDNVRVAAGWPSKRAMAGGNGGRRIGEAWSNTCSGDKTHEIIISLVLDDAVKVLDVLVHELIHVTVGVNHGHKKPFVDAMKALGLEGKPTATHAGADLKARLERIATRLGPYPHAKLDGRNTEKQSTRMLKMQCDGCGMPIRLARKWLDEYGDGWACPCGGQILFAE